MATTQIPQEQRMVLSHVSWETYERLLRDYESSSAPRFAYDRGVLEIMSPVIEHEKYSRFVDVLVTVWADEADAPVEVAGSTTFRLADAQRGFEPDASFYIEHAADVHGKRRIDLAVDPPPDLVLEIDITHSSIDKLAINAALRVPEVWRYDGTRLEILVLEEGRYVRVPQSHALPFVGAAALADLLREVVDQNAAAWLRAARRWVREALGEVS